MTIRVSLCALSGLLVCGCGTSTSLDTLRYVPEDATVVASVDVAALQRSAVFKDVLGPRLHRAAPWVSTGLERCNVGLDRWKPLVVAAPAERAATLAVVSAPGLGKRSTLDCLAGQMKAIGLTPWVMSDDTHLVFGNGQGRVVDDDTVALFTGSWSSAVTGVLDGTAPTAKDGPIAQLVARAKVDQPLWVGVRLDDRDTNTEKALEVAATGMIGAVTLDSPLSLRATLELADGSDPEVAATRAEALYETSVRDTLANAGVAAAALDSVRFEREGSRLVGTATVALADIDAMVSGWLGSASP
ncbi:MAG: hypothetical protein AAF721_22195 [Myxococcota bacterium]